MGYERTVRWWWLLVVLIGCGARAPRPPNALSMGPAQELALGEELRADLRGRGARAAPEPLQAALQALVARSPAGWESLDWEVLVLPGGGLYGGPSGALVLGEELLALDVEHQRALLAHAMAHAILRHGMRRVRAEALLQLAAPSPTLESPAQRAGLLEALGLAPLVGTSHPFDQGSELDADRLAEHLLGSGQAGAWAALRGLGASEALREHPLPETRLRRMR